MPGSGFEIECPGCRVMQRVTTGVNSLFGAPGEWWGYEQFVCTNCEAIRSCPVSPSDQEARPACEECGAGLVPWEGRVWFERTPDSRSSVEHLKGPCPRCGHTITELDSKVLIDWD